MEKRNKNILNGILLVVIAGMLLTTLAYFTSSDKVENKFTVGDINISLGEPNFLSPDTMTPEELEKVKKDLKENEKLTDEEIEDYLNNHRDNAHMTPGKVIKKDPTVTVEANSEDSYVFAAVDNHITHVLKDIEINSAWDPVEQVQDPNDSNRKLNIYVYTGSNAQDKVVPLNHEDLVLESVFTEITVLKTAINDELKDVFELEKHLDISAFAHQAKVNGAYDYDTAKEAAIEFFKEHFSL